MQIIWDIYVGYMGLYSFETIETTHSMISCGLHCTPSLIMIVQWTMTILETKLIFQRLVFLTSMVMRGRVIVGPM